MQGGSLLNLKNEAAKMFSSGKKASIGFLPTYALPLYDEIASFCLIDDKGTHHINGRKIKIGAPGCVGTLSEYRNQGIGLTMVKHVTQKQSYRLSNKAVFLEKNKF